jgi:hypothetical protein
MLTKHLICNHCIRIISTGTIKLPAFQTMMDVAAVVAAAAGSRGIGYDGKMVSDVLVMCCSYIDL